MNKRTTAILPLLALGIFTFLILFPFGTNVALFDWDEINFAESAREMLVTKNFSQVQINYEPFWEKPPLFIWLQALSMHVFGVGEFAARFPNIIVGVFTIGIFFTIGLKRIGGLSGILWALVWLGSWAPHFYFKTGLIDPLFNLLIFLGLYFNYLSITSSTDNKTSVWAGVFTGLAILTKGPVALLVSVLTLFVLSFIQRRFSALTWKQWLLYLFTTALVSSLWFVPEIVKNGPWFLVEFIQYQIELASENVAGHKQPFYYHPIVLLLLAFPASIFALKNIFSLKQNQDYEYTKSSFLQLMFALFWVVLILFSIVETKIVHYSSLCWYPLTFFAAYNVNNWFYEKTKPNKIQLFLFILVGLIWVALFAILYLFSIQNSSLFNLLAQIKDPLALAQINQHIPLWNSWATAFVLLVFGIVFILVLVLWYLKKFHHLGILLFSSIMIVVPMLSKYVVPAVEAQLQGKLVAFYQSIAHKDAYVVSWHKSYAPYFYAKTLPLDSSDAWYKEKNSFVEKLFSQDTSSKRLNQEQRMHLFNHQVDWMIHAEIDKDFYLVFKTNQEPSFILNEGDKLDTIDIGGGFKAFKRSKKREEE
jgi:4-amino-4-deoxy-L-arabinose transferase-like glycosyltransferase